MTCQRLAALNADDRLLLGPLRAAGMEATAAIWDDPEVDWDAFGCAVVRSTWDYHVKPARFRRWLEAREHSGTRLWNPARVLRWNMDKRYLRDLEGRGVPVVPTAWLARGEPVDLRGLLAARGWERAVVKPTVSAGARRTALVTRRDAALAQPGLEALVGRADVMVQPFLEAIPEVGEWSLLFLGGSFSHAALKRPAEHDFRVQEQFGGTVRPADPPPGLVGQAEAVLEAAAACVSGHPRTSGEDLLYARVDGVVERGRLLLLELEVLEPSLFLALAPEAPLRLARAIVERLPRGGP